MTQSGQTGKNATKVTNFIMKVSIESKDNFLFGFNEIIDLLAGNNAKIMPGFNLYLAQQSVN
jgi:hypothetical protein